MISKDDDDYEHFTRSVRDELKQITTRRASVNTRNVVLDLCFLVNVAPMQDWDVVQYASERINKSLGKRK